VAATIGIVRSIARAALAVRRWIFWPHPVRGWWATLGRELAPADLYHAFGTLTIAPALAARDRSPIGPSGTRAATIYDAIDDAIGSNASLDVPGPILRRRNRVETRWARSADAVLTVNDELADRLQRRWGLADLPLVVRNSPEPVGDLVPIDLRAEAGLAAGTRVALFQGRLGPNRGLEASAEAILMVPDAALVLLGFGPGVSAAQARDREPRFRGRHLTLPPRHPDELLAWTAGADVTLIPLPPVSANQRASTPNKFWESIAVGTPVVVVAGLVVMERLVREYDLGVVAASTEPDDLAIAIRTALDRIDGPDGTAWRAAIRRQAADRFSWPPTATAYRSLVRSMSGRTANVAEPGTGSP
jgi:glycosyltransferase involved in cell wall biosynthesis